MKHENIPPITNRIFCLLDEKKLSQSELARMIGTRQSTVSGWKIKKNEPEAELLEPLSKALNVSIEWLITGSDTSIKCDPLPEEQQLLTYYCAANEKGKDRIMEQAEFLSLKYPAATKNGKEKNS